MWPNHELWTDFIAVCLLCTHLIVCSLYRIWWAAAGKALTVDHVGMCAHAHTHRRECVGGE